MSQERNIPQSEADARAMKAAAGLYHAYFTGLILTLVTRRSAGDAAAIAAAEMPISRNDSRIAPSRLLLG